MAVVAAALSLAGCDALGPQDKLGEFNWQELPAAPVTEQSEAVKIGAEVIFLGQLNTPTACFRIEPDLQDNGASLTLLVRVRATQRDGCGETESAYRYDGLLRRVGAAREIRVIHQVENVGNTEFVHTFGEETET